MEIFVYHTHLYESNYHDLSISLNKNDMTQKVDYFIESVRTFDDKLVSKGEIDRALMMDYHFLYQSKDGSSIQVTRLEDKQIGEMDNAFRDFYTKGRPVSIFAYHTYMSETGFDELSLTVDTGTIMNSILNFIDYTRTYSDDYIDPEEILAMLMEDGEFVYSSLEDIDLDIIRVYRLDNKDLSLIDKMFQEFHKNMAQQIRA